MKTTLTILFLFLLASAGYAQDYDTIISNAAYHSYFSNRLREPVMVIYKLYKGGGDCDRAGFRFKNDADISAARAIDYKGSIYDQGHMANAEDFAFDCTLDELTFRFYNCVPQTANLNRGVYKKWETRIRTESQDDSLLVICGNIFGRKKLGKDKIAIPSYCYKVVQSLSTKEVIHVILFKNAAVGSGKEITLESLEEKVGYRMKVKE